MAGQGKESYRTSNRYIRSGCDNTTEMHAILAEFGLPYVYPKAVETAADKIPAEISAEEIAKREDFRKVTTFTIDRKMPKTLTTHFPSVN